MFARSSHAREAPGERRLARAALRDRPKPAGQPGPRSRARVRVCASAGLCPRKPTRRAPFMPQTHLSALRSHAGQARPIGRGASVHRALRGFCRFRSRPSARPVTPEVAGSSPVVPVNSLQIESLVVFLGAGDRRLPCHPRAHAARESTQRTDHSRKHPQEGCTAGSAGGLLAPRYRRRAFAGALRWSRDACACVPHRSCASSPCLAQDFWPPRDEPGPTRSSPSRLRFCPLSPLTVRFCVDRTAGLYPIALYSGP